MEDYSEKMLNNPELLKREILSKKKYWFSKREGYGVFGGIFFLAITAGIFWGKWGFIIGMIVLILAWNSRSSFKKDIKRCNWKIERAVLQPKSERQRKGIAYTSLAENEDLVYTNFRYQDGRVLSGNCKIRDFVEGMEFYTVIVGGKKIVYTWPTYR